MIRSLSIIIISAFCFLAKHSEAQVYSPMLNASCWYMQMANFGGPTYYWYYFGSDSVVNGNTYKTILSTYASSYYVLLREDSAQKKVYAINQTTQSEILLYDYSQTVGNTFQFYNPVSGSNIAATLDSISTVTTSAGLRNKLCYSSGPPNPMQFRIVESVGSLEDPVVVKHFVVDPVFYLMCNYQAGQHVYTNPIFQSSACPAIPYAEVNETELSAKEINIFPNPSNDNITISAKEIKDNFSVTVCDISGRTITKHFFIAEEKATINTSDLKNGIYFLSIEFSSSEKCSTKKMVVQH